MLFGGRRPVFLPGDEGNKAVVVGETTTDVSFKSSGAKVDLALFSSGQYPEVSGVLFSALATWSKVTALTGDEGSPAVIQAFRLDAERGVVGFVGSKAGHAESLVDGAHLFLNPSAEHPLDPAPWHKAGVAIHTVVDGRTVRDFPHRHLISRLLVRQVLKNDAQSIVPHPPEPAQKHERSFPPDGVPFARGGTLGPAASVELLLHRGWTVLVGRDVVDDDWGGLAKQGQHLSLQEFLAAADDDMFVDTSFASLDLAVAAARKHIDAHVENADVIQ